MRSISVDLPEPVGPTNAVTLPSLIDTVASAITGAVSSGKVKPTPSSRTEMCSGV